MNYINDVFLYNEEENNVNGIVEICPGVSDKNELVEPGFSTLKCVRQVKGVYPFYYGSFPQTYAGDKDPLDMILFTNKEHNLLDVVKVDVIGAIKTVDAGEQDDKIICVESDCDLKNVKKQLKQALDFLKFYKGIDSDMVIDKKLVSMEEAESLVLKAHQAWEELKKARPVTIKKTTPVLNRLGVRSNSNNRVRIVKR